MKNWKKVKLGTLLTESKVLSESPDTNRRIKVRLNVLGIEKRPDTNDKEGATKYYIRKAGQFVYGKQNLHKGAFGIIPKELDGFESSLDIPAFDIDDSCYPEWIFYFFKKGNFYLKLEVLAKGVGSKRISPSQIYDLDIFLPSKAEQKSILEEIEEIEKKQNNLIREIEKQENYVFNLRQSILQDAVQGKLTEEWRKQNPNVESVSQLIKKIEAEKGFRNEKHLVPIKKDKLLFTLPKSWVLCCLKDIVEDTHAGKSPQCENRPAEIDEWGVLKTTAIQNLYFMPNENKALLDISKINLSTEVQYGDVLITRAGPSNRVGIVTYVNNTRHKLLLSDKTVRIKYFPKYISGQFLAITLSGGISKLYLDSKKSGMAKSQVNISQPNMKLTPICLPPYKEQIEIVSRVNKLNEHCNNLEIQIDYDKSTIELLMQSVLSELLGKENSISINNEIKEYKQIVLKRKIKYDSKTTYMKLVELLKEHGKLHAEELWKMSEFPKDIDAFYAELKKQIEEEKTIKEAEKGYLELT